VSAGLIALADRVIRWGEATEIAPPLAAPDSDESLRRYVERVLLVYPLFLEVSQAFSWTPTPAAFCPALMTLLDWRARTPRKPVARPYNDGRASNKNRASRRYYPTAVWERLLTALCDQLRTKVWVLHGIDLAHEPLEPGQVDPLRLDFSQMDPIADTLQPDPGHPGPQYCRLTLRPAHVSSETAVKAVAPPQSPDPEWIDLKSEPPPLPRFSGKTLAKAELHQARTDEINSCIKKIAELDGGRTNRPTIRKWGRYWLRKCRQADTTKDVLELRFKASEHEKRRRPEGNPQFHE
jgi:hypothetical protein